MIAIDTNVLLRYLLADDRTQHEAACRAIFEAADRTGPVHVGLNVLAEVWWFLVKVRRISRGQAVHVLRLILDDDSLRVADDEVVEAATAAYAAGPAGFTDYLIAFEAWARGASTTLTFDRAASGHSRFTLLPT